MDRDNSATVKMAWNAILRRRFAFCCPVQNLRYCTLRDPGLPEQNGNLSGDRLYPRQVQ